MAIITGLTEIGAAPASGDQFVMVDVSDTTSAATGTTKRVNASRLALTEGNNTFSAANTFAADVTVSAILTATTLRGNGISVRPSSGTAPLYAWTEVGVADRGVLGFAAGSGDLVYRGGAFSIASGTEHWRTTSAGYLLLGYTTSNGAYRLQVNSQIYATNATIATSDERVKTNIVDLEDGLAAVMALHPVVFDFVEHPVHNFSRERQVGFIAQEIETALDEADYVRSIVPTTENEEQLKGIAADKIVALLVKAVQEQQAQIEALTARVAALEAA